MYCYTFHSPYSRIVAVLKLVITCIVYSNIIVIQSNGKKLQNTARHYMIFERKYMELEVEVRSRE